MARIDSLYCPFAQSLHPDAALVHERSVLWARALGMLPTEHHVRSAHKAKLGYLAARTFPAATRQGLQLAADATMLFFVLDDYIETLGAADEVAAYLPYLLHLLRSGMTGALDDPFASGMIDLRQRMLALGTPRHFKHFVDQVEEIFEANVAEARNRERGQIPDVASYLPLREVTVGIHVMLALVELLEEFRLPDRIRKHPAVRELATRASNIVGWANDLFTYEKEIIQGEIHNLVLVLMNERQWTIAEAVAATVALHDQQVLCFLQEVEQIPSFGAADASVQRYVEMLQSLIRGHLDWAYETGRYRPLDEPAGEPASRAAAA